MRSVLIVLMRVGNLVVFVCVVLIQVHFFLGSIINIVFIMFVQAVDFYQQFALFLTYYCCRRVHVRNVLLRHASLL